MSETRRGARARVALGLALSVMVTSACDDPPAAATPGVVQLAAPRSGRQGDASLPIPDLPDWVEAPAGLDGMGRLVAVGFGLGPVDKPATVAQADARARLEVGRALLPWVNGLLADLDERCPPLAAVPAPGALDPRASQVAAAVVPLVGLGPWFSVPDRGVIYRQGRLDIDDLVGAYRAVLTAHCDAARAAGQLTDEEREFAELHLRASGDLLSALAKPGS